MADYKDLKEALDFALSTAMVVDNNLQDGFQWTDVFSLVPVLSKLPVAVEGIENVPDELEAMQNDEEGRAALITYVKDLYDIDDNHAEALVEQGVRAGVELGVLVTLIRKSKE